MYRCIEKSVVISTRVLARGMRVTREWMEGEDQWGATAVVAFPRRSCLWCMSAVKSTSVAIERVIHPNRTPAYFPGLEEVLKKIVRMAWDLENIYGQ